MYDLIGAHVNDVQGGLPELMGRWNGAANVFLRPFPELRWFHGKGRTVVRAFPDDSQNPDFNDPNLNTMQAARVMVAKALGSVGEYPCSHIQITNEPAISSRDAMKRMSDFDAECSRLMAPKRITLANLGTGNPPRMDWWADYMPAIAQGMTDGAVLLLHAYTWTGADERWLLYRHRMVYEGCPEHGWIGLPKRLWIDLVIGEIGYDKGVVEPGVYGGWQNLMSAAQYAVWLQGVNMELLKDKYCLGAAVFCCSNLDWKWGGYEIFREPADHVAHYCTPLYRDHVAKPKIVNLVKQLPHGEYPRRSTKKIRWSVVHHSGGSQGVVTHPVRHLRAINRYVQHKHGWAGGPYTFGIARDGTIYRCMRDSWVGYQCPGYNWNGRGILYMGNFQKAPPSTAQLRAGRDLLQWLGKPCKEHRETVDTACPAWDIC